MNPFQRVRQDMNPYRRTKRGADTLEAVVAGRILFRRTSGANEWMTRQWRTTDGHVGWHEALLQNLNLFLSAGLIDHARPPGVEFGTHHNSFHDWQPVMLTRAGEYLKTLWCDEPFKVVKTGDMRALVDATARTLAACYVEQSGLLEDAVDRYTEYLRPHAQRVLRDLLG